MSKTPTATLEANRRWRNRNRDYLRDYWRLWRRANRDKARAHGAVKRAIKSGALVRPKRCQHCGDRCVPDAHHHRGYLLPLVVRWLCKACHSVANQTDH